MTAISVKFEGVNRTLAALNYTGEQLQRVRYRVIARARRDVIRLFIRILKQEINFSTTRQTGALLGVKVSSRSNRSAGRILLTPDFPRTRYQTPLGRGRRDASKQGQYAFVVNARKEFIQRAIRRMENSGEVQQILIKHAEFIVNQILSRA